MKDKGVSDGAQQLHQYLYWELKPKRSNSVPCRNKQASLAIGKSERMVCYYKGELVAKGIVKLSGRKFDPLTGKCKPTVYNLRCGMELCKVAYGFDTPLRMDKPAPSNDLQPTIRNETMCNPLQGSTSYSKTESLTTPAPQGDVVTPPVEKDVSEEIATAEEAATILGAGKEALGRKIAEKYSIPLPPKEQQASQQGDNGKAVEHWAEREMREHAEHQARRSG